MAQSSLVFTGMEPKVETLADGTQQAEFNYDFALEGKSLTADVDENGDLWIEGYASDFGVDRQEEAFEPGAFARGLKSFLETNPIMLYHHQADKALGQFVDARLDEKGLWVRGRVDAPASGSWAEDVFQKIRKGTIKAFSVGGIFRRRMTEKGPRIYDVDLGEISVTPFPINPRTTFALAAKKAFDSESEAGHDDRTDADRANEAAEEGVVTPRTDEGSQTREEPLRTADIPEVEPTPEEATEGCSECAAKAKAAEEAAAAVKKAEEEEAAAAEEAVNEISEEDRQVLTNLFNRLDALGSKLETVGERFSGAETATEEADVVSQDEETASSADDTSPEGDGFPSDDELASEYAEFALVRSGSGIVPPTAEGKATDHSSAGHAGLERSFRKNWVEKVGGFPRHNWIYRAAKHLVADEGMSIGRAIAVAVNAARKLCATGDLNFPGKQSANPASRAEACAAVAEWERMKAQSKSD